VIVESHDIDNMSKVFRAHFVNSLSGYKSANLLGSSDALGNTNLAMISSAFHLGADPALMGYINRPHSVSRHSLENIIENRFYTLNHVKEDMITASHQTSARYPKHQSEFTVSGLTEQWINDFPAPFVSESEIKIGLKYVEHHTLLNQAVLVIGTVVLVEFPGSIVRSDGSIDLIAADTVALSGLDTYSKVSEYKRMSYAKTDKFTSAIDSSNIKA
jgi:flavin reductase (DIM6/NTAB) family NADH-FMN oxidoreductase RutF